MSIMRKRRWRDLSKTEQAILIALVGGAIILNPRGGRVVVSIAKHYLKKWWDKGGPYIPPEQDSEQVRASLYHLKKNQYIDWKFDKKKGVLKLEMTSKGRETFGDKKELGDTKITRPEKWDGLWRFVLFDVPEKSRTLRDAFRYHIKTIGLFRFQKSVWIYPFPCEAEVRYASEVLGIKQHVIMFAAKIDNDRILKRYFLREKVLFRRDLNLFDKGVCY